MNRVLALGAWLLAAMTSFQAAAHQIDISRAHITIGQDRQIDVEIGMKASDAERAAGVSLPSGPDGAVDPAALGRAAAAISAYGLAHSAIEGRNGQACRPGDSAAAADGDGIRLTLRWDCREVEEPLRYASTLLTDRSPTARQIVQVDGDDTGQRLLSAADPSLVIAAPPPSLASVVLRYVLLGIEHIATGYDHVAFLVAVILWGRKLWPLVKIVTAFTLSHSVTLTLSALGWFTLPETVTEPAIAVTIVLVAGLNFISRDIGGRWIETFFFGFVHGFGFASALKETGLPAHARLPALASFNIGVEIGQIAVIALALPILLGIDRLLARGGGLAPPRDVRVVFGASALIVLAGSYWFIERTLLGSAT